MSLEHVQRARFMPKIRSRLHTSDMMGDATMRKNTRCWSDVHGAAATFKPNQAADPRKPWMRGWIRDTVGIWDAWQIILQRHATVLRYARESQ
jgi:hypothetical protein